MLSWPRILQEDIVFFPQQHNKMRRALGARCAQLAQPSPDAHCLDSAFQLPILSVLSTAILPHPRLRHLNAHTEKVLIKIIKLLPSVHTDGEGTDPSSLIFNC